MSNTASTDSPPAIPPPSQIGTLRLEAYGGILAFVVTILFVLRPESPYLMAAFTFLAQPLFLICAALYLQRVLRELRQKDVL